MEAQHFKRQSLISLFLVALLILGVAGAGRAATVPAHSYIVQAQSAATAARLVEQVGGTVTSRLNIINGVAAALTDASKNALAADSHITAITANASVEKADGAPPTDYPDITGADLAWGQGAIGTGVSVAVIDTGLGWQSGLFKNVNGKTNNHIVGWVDFVEGSKNPTDPNGHGTHVAGIIANTQIGKDGEYDGMAPGVNLVGVRVLDENGAGTYETVLEGLQWVMDHKDALGIRVVNMSLLAQVQSPYWADPLNQAVMKAWQDGIVVVVAAGNGGPKPATINVPGNNPYVITVGAFTDAFTPADWSDDYLAPFSAAGPTLDGFVKPDLVAPGAHIVSTMLPNSTIAKEHQGNRDGGQYFSMAGTSQAAAVVSGSAALVIAQHPELTPDQVKYRLMITAIPWVKPDGTDTVYSMWQMGAGRLNAYDAVFGQIEGSANQGMDVAADLAGTTHYEGYSYFNEDTQSYNLHGDFQNLAGSFGHWSGSYGPWTGSFGVWSGSFGVWSGSMGVWSGSMGVWSGSMGVWSGSFGVWSGSMGVWSGSMGVWSGSMGVWSGANALAQPIQVPTTDSPVSIGQWVEEPGASH